LISNTAANNNDDKNNSYDIRGIRAHVTVINVGDRNGYVLILKGIWKIHKHCESDG
jgi:hypothetical protein